MPLALHIFEERYQEMIGRCLDEDRPFGVLLIRAGVEAGGRATPHRIGTAAQIVGHEKLLQGRMNLVAVGQQRFRLLKVSDNRPYLIGQVEYIPQVVGERIAMMNAALAVRRLFVQYMEAIKEITQSKFDLAALPEDAANLAYTVATAMQIGNDVKQTWLVADSVQELLQGEASVLPKEIARLHLMAETEKQREKKDDELMGPFSRN